ncbi:hypothetical protein RhiirA5_403390 [Rhizophagus irregularis]|uniref:DUF659 domain-containing protein n=1 Tax=Rhizophagus irregularis TaxID=588596 RepID=A0A2N0NZM4_9GLOM|nr:hypothetical protein RhiirA5_403390 [Rhizophagus irregularis]
MSFIHVPSRHTLSVYTKEEHHTGENIAKGIEDCVISIGIDKFTAVITDNANNMKSAWRILKEKLDPRFNGELVNSGNWHDIIEEEIIRIAGKENEVRNGYLLSRKISIYSIYQNIRILRELEEPLTVKELIKSGVKISDLESDDEKLGEESNKELKEYEENEFDLDLDD